MKNLHLCTFFLCVCLLASACRKGREEQVIALPEVAKEGHMTGNIDSEQFTASSLNASVNKYPNGTLELNVNGWNQPSDQTIYFSIQNYKGVDAYGIVPFTTLEAKTTNAWYEKNHSNKVYSHSGMVIIQYADPEMITGIYDFWINKTRIAGEFGIKPHYSDK